VKVACQRPAKKMLCKAQRESLERCRRVNSASASNFNLIHPRQRGHASLVSRKSHFYHYPSVDYSLGQGEGHYITVYYVMIYYIMIYCIMIYYIMIYYIMIYYIMIYYIMIYYIMIFYIMIY